MAGRAGAEIIHNRLAMAKGIAQVRCILERMFCESRRPKETSGTRFSIGLSLTHLPALGRQRDSRNVDESVPDAYHAGKRLLTLLIELAPDPFGLSCAEKAPDPFDRIGS